MVLIVYNTKNPIGLRIKMTNTAEKVWKMLKESYRTISDLGANTAENILRAMKYSDGMDFQEHITNLQLKWNNTVKKRAEIKDNQFRAIVIWLLSASWDYIVASLQSTKTSIELITELNVYWECLKECLMLSAKPNSTALLAKTSQPQNKLVCTNSNCGHTRHTIKNCYWRGGSKEGQFLPNFGHKYNTTSIQATLKLQTSVVNMASTTLTQNPPQTTYALVANMQFTPTAVYNHNLQLLESYLANIEISTIAFALSSSTTKVPTYADSGATDHCFVKRSDFEKYQAYFKPCQGVLANCGGLFNVVSEWITYPEQAPLTGYVQKLYLWEANNMTLW